MAKRRRVPEDAEAASEEPRHHKHQRKSHTKAKTSASKKVRSLETPEASVFQNMQLELTISLLPSGLTDVSRSVQQSLRQFLLKYSSGMKGIPLAFDNIKILKSGKGAILNELPHIHYAVVCDAIVFAPRPGNQLTGVVRKSFHSHLSLVVLNYFNASISSSELQARGYHFDSENEVWLGDKASSVSIDDKIDFIVQKVHESAGIISIEGGFPLSLSNT